jgi:SET domain-containing protein
VTRLTVREAAAPVAAPVAVTAAVPDRPAYQKFAVTVGPSAIDGQGVFAAEAVKKRLKIGEIRGESISVDEARIRATRSERIMIVELSAKRAIDFSKSADPMRYTNHSCQANAQLVIRNGRVEFYALRDITPGEEITVDYGETHHEGRLRCQCGAPGCRGAL